MIKEEICHKEFYWRYFKKGYQLENKLVDKINSKSQDC